MYDDSDQRVGTTDPARREAGFRLGGGLMTDSLDACLQSLAELRAIGARWYWAAGDACREIVAMAEDNRTRSRLIGLCAQHLVCGRAYVRQLMQVSERFPEGSPARDMADLKWSLLRAVAQAADTPTLAESLLQQALEQGIDSEHAFRRWLRGDEEPDVGEVMERYRERLRREFSGEYGEMRRDVAREVLAEWA